MWVWLWVYELESELARVLPYLSSMQLVSAIIVTSSAAPLAPPRSSTLSHIRRDFRKKVTEHKMCFDFSL